MILWIASDHAGFGLKEKIKAWTSKKEFSDIEWRDLGPQSEASTDYPLYAQKLAIEILKNKKEAELLKPCGLLICGSGVGVSMAANRFHKIRAVLASNPEVARLSRAHNASNVLCLGSRLNSEIEAEAILKSWLETPFEGGRHENRINLMDKEIKV